MILGIYGSGGLGREVLDLARTINGVEEKWEKILFIDDYSNKTVINEADILSFNDFITAFPIADAKIVIAVGEPKVRKELRERVVEVGYGLQTLIHPSAFVGSETRIGEGSVIQFGSFVSCNLSIGQNVLIQSIATIGHDSSICADTVISTFVAISGNCKIGERVYIGVSVPVRESISIGSDAIVGMGSVVLRDIPEGVIALGNPARAMKKNEDGRVFS